MDRSFIELYAAGSQKLPEAIHGLSVQDMQRVPPAEAAPQIGQWSIHQIIIHLADSELVYAERMRRVVAEKEPPLVAFDQDRWAEALAYLDQPVEGAVTMVEMIRRQTAAMLRALPDEAFSRRGIHNQAGPLMLRDLVIDATEHMDHHLKFIAAKRRWMEQG